MASLCNGPQWNPETGKYESELCVPEENCHRCERIRLQAENHALREKNRELVALLAQHDVCQQKKNKTKRK